MISFYVFILIFFWWCDAVAALGGSRGRPTEDRLCLAIFWVPFVIMQISEWMTRETIHRWQEMEKTEKGSES